MAAAPVYGWGFGGGGLLEGEGDWPLGATFKSGIAGFEVKFGTGAGRG